MLGKVNKKHLIFTFDNKVGINLRRGFVALGLILVIVGGIVSVWAFNFHVKVVLHNYPWSKTNEWETDEIWFNATDRLIFELAPGKYWGLLAERVGEFPFPVLFVDISIIDPNDGKTNLTLVFAQAETGGLQFWGGRVTSNDGGLTMEKESFWAANNKTIYYNYFPVIGENAIGGIVNFNGFYKVVVFRDKPAPPARVKLLRQKLAVEHPYRFIVPISGATVVCGVFLSSWGLRSFKKRFRPRVKSK